MAAKPLFPKKPANPASAKPTPKPAPLPAAKKPGDSTNPVPQGRTGSIPPSGRSSGGGQRTTVRI